MSRDGFSIEGAFLKGRPLPQWYLDRPEAGPTDEFYLTAFWDLSTCRPSGWSLAPIPWNFIIEYASFVGLDGENTYTFSAIIRKLDIAFMAWHANETKKPDPPVDGSTGRIGIPNG